ncbi:hypothetical protein JW930_02400 [Candidatus Woesearchaeota archaeon]|nr:hypothetical protein [Candidatus Woesearchaeota archaeon]
MDIDDVFWNNSRFYFASFLDACNNVISNSSTICNKSLARKNMENLSSWILLCYLNYLFLANNT